MTEWERVGSPSGSGFVRWTDAGQTLEGVYRGQKESRFKDRQTGELLPNGMMDTATGPVTFALSTVLRDRFSLIPEGSLVKIVYAGKQKSQAGQTFHAFDVFVAKGTALLEPSDDVPF